MLEYKSNWNDKTVVMIDRFFPSSKMCNKCNYIKDDLTLKDREWTCPSCNTHHNRDLNASLNILNQGLKILSGSWIESDIKQKQGESSSVEEAMNLETTTSLV
jgi:transposase